jgi:hypothetical protein
MKKHITKQLIESVSYKELREYCHALKVKFSNQPENQLRAILIEALPQPSIKQPTNNKSDKNLNSEIYNIMRRKMLSKSDKMRALYDLGMTKPAEIAKITKCHYSFVYGVIQRYKSN